MLDPGNLDLVTARTAPEPAAQGVEHGPARRACGLYCRGEAVVTDHGCHGTQSPPSLRAGGFRRCG
nr:MAG TPA_asm: hypothetical protein [Caudoviricetes sp.]